MKNFALKSIVLSAIAVSAAAFAAEPVTAPVTPSTGTSAAASAESGSWLDRVSDTFKELTNKIPELTDEAKKYSDELKAQWPELKNQFSEQWNKGVEQGKEYTTAFNDWVKQTFSEEKLKAAENWLEDFKKGTTEKVVDPLVPYLLTLRYPNPLDEWNAGYRRMFPVQLAKDTNPVEVSLPLSWDLGPQVQTQQDRVITWRSDSGSGSLDIFLVAVPEGSTPESLVAGLEKRFPEAASQKLSGITRVEVKAAEGHPDAVYYYAIPLQNRAVLLGAEVIAQEGQDPAKVNETLESRQEFFDTIAKNVFQK